jgi:hypothetical protein
MSRDDLLWCAGSSGALQDVKDSLFNAGRFHLSHVHLGGLQLLIRYHDAHALKLGDLTKLLACEGCLWHAVGQNSIHDSRNSHAKAAHVRYMLRAKSSHSGVVPLLSNMAKYNPLQNPLASYAGAGDMKLTCTGPLRPTMCTFLTALLFKASRACCAMSVLARLWGGFSRMRAQSSATFPSPSMVTSST